MTVPKTLVTTIAVALVFCFAIPDKLGATAPIVTFTASGTFASTPTSGSDQLKLSGEPFEVSISVSEATAPFKHGPNWAAFNKLKLTGAVHSGLPGATPVTIGSGEATIIQAFDPGQYDTFTMEAPIKVVGISLTIKAVIVMPFGTFKNPLLQPFGSPVALAPGNATMTYSDGTSSTVLAIQTGALTATIPAGGPEASVRFAAPVLADALTSKFYTFAC